MWLYFSLQWEIKMTKKDSLPLQEQELENEYELLKPIKNEASLIQQLSLAAKMYMRDKKMISIRVANNDLERIKANAYKLGVPYQTYINMLIHKDATSQLDE